MSGATVFLLSPANCAGKRARMLMNSVAFPLAQQLSGEGAPLGEVFSFMSSLYFRGKLAYAKAYGEPPGGWPASLVITPGRGLVSPDVIVRTTDLQAMALVPIDPEEPRYLCPLLRDAAALERALGPAGRVVLLGSMATDKYVRPLTQIFGDRLHFPIDFVGRGDMGRGGLMLRCAREGKVLAYAPVAGAERRGSRPPRLPRR
ncbi:MAG: hypothetical protein ABI877_16815 [Gemmatimonadaceae bacterium]